jgi:hypothetical protein
MDHAALDKLVAAVVAARRSSGWGRPSASRPVWRAYAEGSGGGQQVPSPASRPGRANRASSGLRSGPTGCARLAIW